MWVFVGQKYARLNVVGLWEEIKWLDDANTIPAFNQAFKITRQRRRVAGDVHQFTRRVAQQAVNHPLAQAGAWRVDYDQVRRQIKPRQHLLYAANI